MKTPNTLFSSVFEDFYNILENSKLNNSHEEIFQTYDLLSDDKKEFFQSAVMLKNLESINNLTTLPYKKYYKYFSDRIDKLDVSLKGINVGFNNERMKEIEEIDDSVELSTSAYKKLKNGKAYMLDENYNPIEVSEKEMEEKGFLGYEYYEKFKHEFFEKNHNVFRNLLTFDKTKLNANEKNDE